MRNQPNIFEILGVSHFEIRHSHFLAWLFDPKGSHGIGDYFLKRFLLDILQDNRSYLNVIDIHSLLNENIIIHREKYNIDILIEFENTLLVIENKINASESNNQLQKYKDSVLKNFANKKPIFVYLTKYGTEASLNQFYIEASYQKHILEYLNDLILLRSGTIQDHVLIYIKDYIDNLNNNVMQQSEANSLAEKIYRQHQELFDFIIANRPDSIAIIKEKMNELLVADGFILGSDHKHFSRFLPVEINNIVPKSKQKSDWKEGEAFLWEFRYPTNNEGVEFKIAISPYFKILRNKLIELFENANLKKDYNNDWAVYEIKLYDIEYARIYEEDYIESIYKQIMEEQRSKIDKLSQIILANQNIFN
ncbi:PD-(D/E)XK nuclease family protein [Chishuiella sp.]|uniref:PDDEXK-like family protein n=1 Tax=Chishuiella sp. TaxID=1969467 RepID=UPI0028ACF05B|nr:PD-(D/E)XK nuclease family protein [Chishuiella sp.]